MTRGGGLGGPEKFDANRGPLRCAGCRQRKGNRVFGSTRGIVRGRARNELRKMLRENILRQRC
jgi:hypothetical protein